MTTADVPGDWRPFAPVCEADIVEIQQDWCRYCLKEGGCALVFRAMRGEGADIEVRTSGARREFRCRAYRSAP